MKTTNKILIGLFVLILIGITVFLIALRIQVKSAVFVEPSGNIVTKAIDVTTFTGIDASGNIKLQVRQGSSHEVTVRADDNLMEYVITEVNNDVLKVSLRAWGGKDATIEVDIELVDIGSLLASAGARVHAENVLRGQILDHAVNSGAQSVLQIDFDKLELVVGSGAETLIGGRVREMIARNSGGGLLNAAALEAEKVKLNSSSGAQSDLFVTESLEVRASSGSVVNYTGNPLQREVSSSSGAQVNPR